jgi:hypothetical protein
MASIRKEVLIDARPEDVWDATRWGRLAQAPRSGLRFVWTADLLPNEAAQSTDEMMERGIGVVKETLEAHAGVGKVATPEEEA